MGRRIWQMMKKEFIQVWRDRRLPIFLILPPIVQLVIYGYAINFDIRQVPFGIFDEDRSQASESLLSRLTASEYLRLTDAMNSEATLNHLNLPRKLETPVVIDPRAWLNPNLESKNAFVPGVIAMVVMLVSLMLTALSVVREREIGTMAQILVSPISPLGFLSGRMITSV